MLHSLPPWWKRRYSHKYFPSVAPPPRSVQLGRSPAAFLMAAAEERRTKQGKAMANKKLAMSRFLEQRPIFVDQDKILSP